MAYFLGKDVAVHLAVEQATGTNCSGAFVDVTANPALITATLITAGDIQFAGGRDGGAATIAVPDLTGVDISIGAVDEDISYFGYRSVTKAQIKNETTVSLTRKKKDSSWDAIFNGGRYGCDSTGDFTAFGLTQPTINTGYRIYVTLKGSGDQKEIFTIMGACVQAHSTSVNADGTSEETMEFMSYVTPNVGNALYSTALTAPYAGGAHDL